MVEGLVEGLVGVEGWVVAVVEGLVEVEAVAVVEG